jgi:23S rRNA-/tRNA-specific pseudouridylate synthase
MWFGGRHPDGGVHKEYIARVKGRFMDEEVTCEEPLLTVDRQVGLNCVHPDGRVSPFRDWEMGGS